MTVKNIDLLAPDFVIFCKNINHSKDIYEIMRQRGITRSYAYSMIRKPSLLNYEFIKVGMSCPTLTDREHQVGERLVRQVSWIPGWQGPQPKTSNGLDFWLNIQSDLIANNKVPITFNKNDIEIAVWNVSIRMATSDILLEQEWIATAWTEGELAMQHKIKYGKLPALNYADPSTTKAYKGAHISNAAFQNLFEIT